MSEISLAARRIAEFAAQHPDYPVIAFDADGQFIDWMTAGGWVNGSVRDERFYTFGGGGVSEVAVQCDLDRQDSRR